MIHKNRILLNTARIEHGKLFKLEHVVSPAFLDFAADDVFETKGDVDIKLTAEDTGTGILVKGDLSTIVSCQCSRCLEKYPIFIEEDDFYEYFEEFDDHIDLTESIRETILLALPGKGLCDEKCSGICFFCGTNLNTSSCKCSENEIQEEVDVEDQDQGIWGCLDNLNF
ncbi:MAG: DUF177 domain-containing protein [Lentisphaeria bacterium]|nr:DUF177 domain-containing protein [Lentisphaeria bacterium]